MSGRKQDVRAAARKRREDSRPRPPRKIWRACPTLAIVAGGVLIALSAPRVISAVIQLPGWARLRQQQMEGIAERVASAIAGGEPAAPEALPLNESE